MKSKYYLDENANLLKQLRFLRFVVFILAVAVVVNGLFVYSTRKYDKVVLLPPQLEEEAYVSYHDASESYLASMAKHVLSLRFNYTPANVSDQFNSYLKLLSSSFYPDEMKALYKIKDEVVKSHVASAFFPEKVEVNKKEKKVYVFGKLNQWTYDKKFLVDESRLYVIKYSVNAGRFVVESLVSCKNKDKCPE